MSVSARDEGEFWTQEFVFSGRALLLNSWSRFGGGIAVELLHEGIPVKGFTFEDFDEILGDWLWKQISWRGNSNLAALAGKSVQLHFRMLRSRLYAFRFSEEDKT